MWVQPTAESCYFNLFSARSPRLLEEICWQFAAGLPAFSSLPFFELRPQLVCKVGSIFGLQARPRKRVPVLLFKTVSRLGKSLGPKFYGRHALPMLELYREKKEDWRVGAASNRAGNVEE